MEVYSRNFVQKNETTRETIFQKFYSDYVWEDDQS